MGSRTKSIGFIAAALLLLVLAGGVRVTAAIGSLWLDEIWTLHLLNQVASPVEIFTGIHHDNNHYLNTLCLYWTGDNRPWLLYRTPAIVCGVLTVLAAGWIASRRGRPAQLTVMTLIGTSYLLVHYASEARGYSSAVLFALLGYETLRRFLRDYRSRWAAAFVACVALGLLSHLMFIHIYGAAICWSLSCVLTKRFSRSEIVWHLGRIHLVPVMLLGLLYWTDIRHLEFGGGPDYSALRMILQVGSLSLGGPAGGWLATTIATLLVVGVVVGIGLLRTAEDGDDFKFLLLVILLPVIQMVIARPQFMFVRYFLFAIVFSQLLAGYAIAELLRCRRLGQLGYTILMVLFVSANMLHYSRLLEHGRGQYLAALEFMVASHDDDPLTISGDHNHGLRKLVEFYSTYLRTTSKVAYYDVDDWPAEGPNWLILHQYGHTPADAFDDEYVIQGHTYRLQRVFDTAILSGWRWHCYQRQS